jgi:hypothetical protein
MHIVSHKTLKPIAGEAVDLHEAARGWLEAKAVHGEIGLPRGNVWLEVTKAAKIRRIRELHCDVFIDDLPELLLDPEFPAKPRRVLFAPLGASVKDLPANVAVAQSWSEITSLLSHELD